MKPRDPVLKSDIRKAVVELVAHDEGWFVEWLRVNQSPLVMSMEDDVPTYWLHPGLSEALERRRAIGVGGDVQGAS